MLASSEAQIAEHPAYAVVVEHLRRAIHLGQYGPGDKFPPERQLAEQLGVSRLTLRGAIRVLEGEGYVETRRGSTGGVTVLGSRRSREDLAVLEESVERLAASTTIGAFRQADSLFHLRIAEAANFELLRESVEHARAAMFLPLDALDYELLLSDTLTHHRRILAALRRGDGPAAGRAMAVHVRRTTAELEQILK
jgi:DNA-binding FadR family transcriptional regulator